jgi:hypothetical protein
MTEGGFHTNTNNIWIKEDVNDMKIKIAHVDVERGKISIRIVGNFKEYNS